MLFGGGGGGLAWGPAKGLLFLDVVCEVAEGLLGGSAAETDAGWLGGGEERKGDAAIKKE